MNPVRNLNFNKQSSLNFNKRTLPYNETSNGVKEALLYEKLSGQKTRCNICQRRCLLEEGATGYCGTRKNIKGKLFSLDYGLVSCQMVSPIEKKPFFHFYPGSHWFSLGTFGCNFRCPGCQNYDISYAKPDEQRVKYVSPQESVKLARDYDTIGISWTYNEPTVWFEYTLDSAKLAKKEGLLTNYVTNGYMTQEALDLIGSYLDAMRVDIKGFNKKTYRNIGHISDFQGILEIAERAQKKWGIWIEIVTNIIPTYNDDSQQLKNIPSWIHDKLGKSTPWHVTQFVPYLKLAHLYPTPVKTLEKAREIGLKEGLEYVYIGNIPGHSGENTYCPGCGELLIRRNGFSIVEMKIKEGKCPHCGKQIPMKIGNW